MPLAYTMLRQVPNYNATMANTALRNYYQNCRKALRVPVDFAIHGNEDQQHLAISALRDLIIGQLFVNLTFCALLTKTIDSDMVNGRSKNIRVIKIFCLNSNLLRKVFFAARPGRTLHLTDLYKTVTVALFHLSTWQRPRVPTELYTAEFRHWYDNRVYDFGTSRQVVYDTSTSQPLMIENKINMLWLLHLTNFFKKYISDAAHGIIYHEWRDLEVLEWPRRWQTRLTDGTHMLGRHFKGTYAYVEPNEIAFVRNPALNRHRLHVMDNFNEEQSSNGFEEFRFTFITDEEDILWPYLFSTIHGMEQINTSYTARHSGGNAPVHFRVEGPHRTPSSFEARGWLQGVDAQEGIPGWQKLIMMGFKRQPDGSIDPDDMHAYEAIVLPGGQIILGRWWYADTGRDFLQQSGPFMWWNVDAMHGADDK
ncbi:hypothetical protein BDZ85DRAFT_262614 [Elsinoe ampelina]|uniref:Uncharacterized protein n=1 Tax=Elsinoe ampelina TaxID=302913 RepID=A0A6A6GBA4_9PEZI|nr:hypothetical protein BDZ85DRAFT_262614 [Elsinoe ampelina]